MQSVRTDSVMGSQVAHAQSVHRTLGEVDTEECGLAAVAELMLDITESSVAFCWELGTGQPCTLCTCTATAVCAEDVCCTRMASAVCAGC